MVRSTVEEKGKKHDKESSVRMVSRSTTVRNVVGRAFVPMGSQNSSVRNVTVVAFVSMGNESLI